MEASLDDLTKDVVCFGHIVYLCDRCENCASDELNKSCENYRSVGLLIYEIGNKEDNNSENNRNN